MDGSTERMVLSWRSIGISSRMPVIFGALRSCLAGSSTMQKMTGISTISSLATSAAFPPTANSSVASEARIFRASFWPRATSPCMSYSMKVVEDGIVALNPATAWLYAARSADLRIATSAAPAGPGEKRTARPTKVSRQTGRMLLSVSSALTGRGFLIHSYETHRFSLGTQDSRLRTQHSDLQGQPAHHAAANGVAQWMFFVHIVQRVEHRHRDFRLPRVAGRRLLLPEAICAAQVQKVVAADAFVGWREATKRRELRESNIDWIGGSSHVIERYFATQPVLPVSSQSDVPLKPRRAPSRATCECLADLFIRIIGESAEPASRKKLKAGLSTIN